MMKLSITLIMTLFIALNLKGQVLDKSYYSELKVPDKATYLVDTDSLYIETLILGDKSTLKFKQDAQLIVERAFIGEYCMLDASGTPGEHGNVGKIDPTRAQMLDAQGQDGQDGVNLRLVMVFETLGSLTINTSGGEGGNGGEGEYGGSGQTYIYKASVARGTAIYRKGGNGGNGGNGGHGGNISLMYTCKGFVPRISHASKKIKQKHAINLNYFGEKGGTGGQGGKGWSQSGFTQQRLGETKVTQASLNGTRGKGGKDGKDGEVLIKRMPQ